MAILQIRIQIQIKNSFIHKLREGVQQDTFESEKSVVYNINTDLENKRYQKQTTEWWANLQPIGAVHGLLNYGSRWWKKTAIALRLQLE